jgi:hypothetical protein
MSESAEMVKRHAAALEDLAALGLEIARDLKARAIEAKTAAEAEGLALAFHRVSRAVRLTLALEARLAREGLELGRQEDLRRAGQALARTRQVRAVVARDIWNETDGQDARALIRELDAVLETEALFEEFLQGPVEACIARIREDLSLPANDPGEAPQVAAAPIEPAPPDPPPDDYWRTYA